jgi:hypothetical protein
VEQMMGMVVTWLASAVVLVALRMGLQRHTSAVGAALVVVLAASAAAFNVIVPVPSIDATITVVLCAALVLGLASAASVGVVAVVASSVTGGIGVWTVWQCVAVLMVAALGASMRRLVLQRSEEGGVQVRSAALGLLTVASVLLYDVVVTVPTALTIAPAGSFAGNLVGALLLGVAFTLTHTAWVTLLTVSGGPALIAALARARDRSPATWPVALR